MKYRPDFPDFFGSKEDARAWVRPFFDWYNNEHYHSSLGLLTPATVHYGQAAALLEKRQRVLDAAYAAHFERSQVSEVIRFFPVMVKYGLPDVVSCWARSLGVPLRQVAIQLAERYKKQYAKASYDSFQYWLGSLDYEELRYNFKLQSPFLEDIYKAIYTSGNNRILREISSYEEFFPVEMEVQGIHYENRLSTALRARAGDSVFLSRDYDNYVDRNAVQVSLRSQSLGFVPRRYAQILGPEMDIGMQYQAVISRIEEEDQFLKVYITISPQP
jgi:HIRAN domain